MWFGESQSGRFDGETKSFLVCASFGLGSKQGWQKVFSDYLFDGLKEGSYILTNTLHELPFIPVGVTSANLGMLSVRI